MTDREKENTLCHLLDLLRSVPRGASNALMWRSVHSTISDILLVWGVDAKHRRRFNKYYPMNIEAYTNLTIIEGILD